MKSSPPNLPFCLFSFSGLAQGILVQPPSEQPRDPTEAAQPLRLNFLWQTKVLKALLPQVVAKEQ